MKTSELIEKLQAEIKEHGDLEVCVTWSDEYNNIKEVEDVHHDWVPNGEKFIAIGI